MRGGAHIFPQAQRSGNLFDSEIYNVQGPNLSFCNWSPITRQGGGFTHITQARLAALLHRTVPYNPIC
jgi:hypothetical protein